MDIIGNIHPPSSRRQSFILVATDYFTKWVEAVLLANMTYQEVIKFVKEHIIHRYGIPQTITADQGTVLPAIEWPPSPHSMGSLFCIRPCIMRRQEAILPLEITVPSLRVLKQNSLSPEQYDTTMLQRLDDVHEDQMMALENIRANKVKEARAYNKKIRRRTFREGDLVWKAVLPEGCKDNTFGKWSPRWEGPYQVSKVLPNDAYRLMNIDGTEHRNVINAKHLKGYMSPLELG
ncbi:uncharacterized protein LOC127263243 [Andrographis paniculata]|uniref:uncharacterized protein LOC127263243 n=1 Tax=Andrographis paniculata TaxID=175694 RepID=UPI0021E6E0DB|nr:uncharacterized protein LOC127263243 [Andrographis paniculata]